MAVSRSVPTVGRNSFPSIRGQTPERANATFLAASRLLPAPGPESGKTVPDSPESSLSPILPLGLRIAHIWSVACRPETQTECAKRGVPIRHRRGIRRDTTSDPSQLKRRREAGRRLNFRRSRQSLWRNTLRWEVRPGSSRRMCHSIQTFPCLRRLEQEHAVRIHRPARRWKSPRYTIDFR
jgi:hypothetical protein